MYELTVSAVVTACGPIALAFTYLFSKDPGRRQRARESLKPITGGTTYLREPVRRRPRRNRPLSVAGGCKVSACQAGKTLSLEHQSQFVRDSILPRRMGPSGAVRVAASCTAILILPGGSVDSSQTLSPKRSCQVRSSPAERRRRGRAGSTGGSSTTVRATCRGKHMPRPSGL